jgi:DNA-binding winged helix-turn-helix (wHTH) protein/tetratricopeptide (TPR) repeat protein
MSLTRNDIYRFDEFELDPSSRTFSRHGEPIPLYPKAFEILIYLVINPGRVVTKEEIFKAVWPESFVEEGNLARQVSSLRRAMGDKSGCIVTIPGRGYQFAARVEGVPSAGVPPASVTEDIADLTEDIFVQRVRERTQVVIEESFPAPTQPNVIPAEKKQRSSPVYRSRALVTGAAILAVAGTWVTGTYLWKKAHGDASPMQAEAGATGAPQAHRRSIAVLGFRNLSGRPEEAWLSTAMAEMLSTELVAGEKLRLVSGEDIARSKAELPLADVNSLSRDTLSRLHKNLNSDLIVLGSYTALREKLDTRIRLDLRLQDTAAGETVADIAVTGSEADLFDMVSQAGSQLRGKLGVEEISPVEAVSVRGSLPASRDAARLYAEGLARLRVFDALGSRTLLEQAVAADPKFAMAHSAMAEAWARLGYDKKAQSEARQAYDLSANLSREEKLLVEGRYREFGHEYETAIDVYRTLFTLFPDNVDEGLKLAAVQARGGKAHDALATVESLRKLAPPASEDPRIDLQEALAWDVQGDYKHQEHPLALAVAKAQAAKARLLLAGARKQQCWVFEHTQQVENAVAACRESAEVYAAAGEHQGEAKALRTWADAIAHVDAQEAIRLYRKSYEIARAIGSEIDMAVVQNNLGNTYLRLGDPASAEKLQREALATFWRLDDKDKQSSVTGNLANELKARGDLPGAMELYEQEVELSRATGDTGDAAYAGNNIATIHKFQGDFARAKQRYEQSLAIWQKSGDQDASVYAMWGWGDLLIAEGDFAGARKLFERALGIVSSAGEQLSIAEGQLPLAEISLDEGRSPLEQEAAVRKILDVFQKQQAHDDEIDAWSLLSLVLVAEGKATEAREAMQQARSLAEKSQNPKTRWEAAVDGATVVAAQKDAAHSAAALAARRELTEIVAKAHKLGYRLIELDARLALAELEMRAGQTAEGRAHLTAIESEAKAIGYNLVVRKAVIARG